MSFTSQVTRTGAEPPGRWAWSPKRWAVPNLSGSQNPFNAPPPRHHLRLGVTSPALLSNRSSGYWQAAPAAAAKREVSWGWSDGPALEPAAAAAAPGSSRATATAAAAGAGVAAGVEAVRVNGRESSESKSLKLGAEALQVGLSRSTSRIARFPPGLGLRGAPGWCRTGTSLAGRVSRAQVVDHQNRVFARCPG